MPARNVATRQKRKKSLNPIANVFNTDELLEQILLKLPLFRLFVLQRTSRAFHDTIQKSSELRKKMFLEETPTRSIYVNPLLSQSILIPSEIFDQPDGLYFTKTSLVSHENFQNATLDLFICSETNAWKPWLPRLRNAPRSNASWKQMLISQPPPCSLFTKIHAQPRWSEKGKKKLEMVYESVHGSDLGDGVTLGELFDELDHGYARFLDDCKRKDATNRRDIRTGRKGKGRLWKWVWDPESIVPGKGSKRQNARVLVMPMAPEAWQKVRAVV